MKSLWAGMDNTPITVFKFNFNIIGPVVTKNCNRSLTSGLFPNNLKIAKIKCIFKKGGWWEVNLHGPCSILPAYPRILGKISVDQIYRLFVVKHLFTPDKRISSESTVIDLSDHVSGNFCSNKYTVATFLDLSKLFDTLDRSTRIRKLRCFGVQSFFLSCNFLIHWWRHTNYERWYIWYTFQRLKAGTFEVK